MSSPTPHPEVNVLLEDLVGSARTILGRGFVGAYLYGSLASGGFDRDSDVDVLVVTDDRISEALFAALLDMHDRIATGSSWCATQVEVSYIPKRALRRFDRADALHPHLDRGKGERLRWMQHDSDWVVQRHMLRERGITLAGPPPTTLIDPVSPDDLRQAMAPVLHEWLASLLDKPSPFNGRGHQSYVVLTLCRVLYTLEHGSVASKRAAAAWAQETLDAPWPELVQRAWEGRSHSAAEIPTGDVASTHDFIRFALQLRMNAELVQHG
jgi:predicted nucleotidyltransferase